MPTPPVVPAVKDSSEAEQAETQTTTIGAGAMMTCVKVRVRRMDRAPSRQGRQRYPKAKRFRDRWFGGTGHSRAKDESAAASEASVLARTARVVRCTAF
jgi:hypothetical protein